MPCSCDHLRIAVNLCLLGEPSDKQAGLFQGTGNNKSKRDVLVRRLTIVLLGCVKYLCHQEKALVHLLENTSHTTTCINKRSGTSCAHTHTHERLDGQVHAKALVSELKMLLTLMHIQRVYEWFKD